MEIRQSLKAVKAAYLACLVLEIAIVVLWYTGEFPSSMPFWVMGVLPPLLVVFVVIRHIKRLMTKITVSADALRYERGLFSKSTSVIELAKVQDVRVHQTMWQRIFNIGDLSLETAGKTSQVSEYPIDQPLEVQNRILDMVKSAAKVATPPLPPPPPEGAAGAPRQI